MSDAQLTRDMLTHAVPHLQWSRELGDRWLGTRDGAPLGDTPIAVSVSLDCDRVCSAGWFGDRRDEELVAMSLEERVELLTLWIHDLPGRLRQEAQNLTEAAELVAVPTEATHG